MKFNVPFLKKASKKEDHYVVVISWGGMRGFYWWWVLKAMEKLWLKNKVDALYWVSAWWLLCAYWSAWYDAEHILEIFLNSDFLDIYKDINFMSKDSILKNTPLKKQIDRDLPKYFEKLNIPTYIWCTDTQVWQSTILSSWELCSALLGTIAIPGIFPAVKRGDEVLVDGGVTDNFPISTAKQEFPNHKIIGISLNKYRDHPKIKNILDNLMVSFEIMLRKDIEPQRSLADYFFCRSLNTPVLEFRKAKLKEIFQLWFEDWIEELTDNYNKLL